MGTYGRSQPGRSRRWSAWSGAGVLADMVNALLRDPFIVYAFLRSRAKRKPFLCPECGEAVEAD
jgi:hypothetical protein